MSRCIFSCGTRPMRLEKTKIMGILNCTPDSFSDGGTYMSSSAALSHGMQMCRDGADMIDIGGQSTRPGYKAVSPEEEWQRIKAVLAALRRETSLPISVDTFYPEVAKKALLLGADIINDVSGFGKEMMDLAAQSSCGCIIMHPEISGGDDILSQVSRFFASKEAQALSMGIARDRLCFDPGIGFEKTRSEDLRLIANISSIRPKDSAFLVGASKKRVVAHAIAERTCETGAKKEELPPEGRIPGTVAAHSIAIMGGANIIRVHDVPQAVQAAAVADAIKGEIFYG